MANTRFHPHYDGRFAGQPLLYEHRGPHLTAMVQAYLQTMASIGAETWLMHGSLLGWWWNKKIMPWDTDLDLMISERTMHYLAAYYNMSIHSFHLHNIPQNKKARLPDLPPSVAEAKPEEEEDDEEEEEEEKPVFRSYMLEVNPHYLNVSSDPYNHIDARWIDTTTGLFIDITTLRHNVTAEGLGMHNRMMCKDGHKYWYDEIYPLRRSVFEGAEVKVPFAYSSLLVEEYGPGALTDTSFENHFFDRDDQGWRMVKAGRRPRVMTMLEDKSSPWWLRLKFLFSW
jgi:hypothetical protein